MSLELNLGHIKAKHMFNFILNRHGYKGHSCF